VKVRFSKSVEFVPAYNGNKALAPEDQFKADLRVLSTGDLLNVMDALQSSGVEGQIDTERANVNNMKEVIALIPTLLPKYATIKNLQGEEGELTINDVIDASFFLPLQVELLLQLSVISTPSEDAEKNLNAPLAS
jgi:hypothetical protein